MLTSLLLALSLRACLVKVRVRIALYTFSHEKEVSDRPLRCRVGLFALVSALPESPGKTAYPLLTRYLQRHLLRLEKWLSLAAFALRLPSLVHRLLSLQEVLVEC